MAAAPVLLLQPPISLKADDASKFGCYPPLGLAYLAASLEGAGIAVVIRDLLVEGAVAPVPLAGGLVRIGLADDVIRDILRRTAPDIVGITNTFTAFGSDALHLARLVRETLPGALVVMGGAHATVEGPAIFDEAPVDAVVRGEGEYVFRDLVRLVRAGRADEARGLVGTIWNTADGVVDNGYGGPIMDLDALPLPAYHLLPMDKYLWQTQANFAVSRRWPIGHMITTRGCLYNCIFCSTTKLYKKFRPRSAQSVLEEINLLKQRYGVREIHFHDDSFFSDPKRVRALCQGLLEHRLDILWQVSQGINSVRLDEDMLELMHASGMYRVGFPIESGDRDVLRFIRKPVRLEKIQRLVKKCNALGIYTFGCFMIGFPEETPEQIEHTIAFMLDSGLDYAKVSIVQPLAGSDLYGVFQRHGLVDHPRHGSTYWHTEYDTLYLTAAQLNALRDKAARGFARRRIRRMLTPAGIRRYLLPKLRSREEIGYFLRVLWLALRGI